MAFVAQYKTAKKALTCGSLSNMVEAPIMQRP